MPQGAAVLAASCSAPGNSVPIYVHAKFIRGGFMEGMVGLNLVLTATDREILCFMFYIKEPT